MGRPILYTHHFQFKRKLKGIALEFIVCHNKSIKLTLMTWIWLRLSSFLFFYGIQYYYMIWLYTAGFLSILLLLFIIRRNYQLRQIPSGIIIWHNTNNWYFLEKEKSKRCRKSERYVIALVTLLIFHLKRWKT